MATVQEPPRAAAGAKYDTFVEQQLNRARARMRWIDMTVAGLGLLGVTLAYGLVMMVVDLCFDLPPAIRQYALTAFLGGTVLGVLIVLARPLLRQINPYYAARQVERTLADAKNSLVNWLDLRHENLPPAIRGAVGQRAARDLSQADLDEAIPARPVWWLAGIIAGLLLAAVILFCVLRPAQFFSLLNRAFNPYGEGLAIATRTRLTLVQPAGGDATVPINQSVLFQVYIDGTLPDPRGPDAPRLRFRYDPKEPIYEELPLEQATLARDWFVRLPAYQVQNGFWYHITAGDAATEEYRIQVRSSPLLTGFEVTYHYRPYLGWPDSTSRDPNLRALRGTEVTLTAHANRRLKEGRLHIEGEKPIAGVIPPDLPEALRFRFLLDRDGAYRIHFTSEEEETNKDPMPYTIQVQHDMKPRVEITEPGERIELPINGTLQVKGQAVDDLGLTAMALRLRVKDGPVLQAKPYRPDKSFQLADGSYPQRLDYLDFIELAKVQDEAGQPVELKPGMEIEYWLEATDNCDYPAANIGDSKPPHVVVLTKPVEPRQQEQQRQQAQNEQEQHQAQQDEQLDQENEAAQQRAEQRQQAEQQQQADEMTEEQKEQERKLDEIARKLEEALKERQQQEQPDHSKGEAKGEEQPQPEGESKDEGRPDTGNADPHGDPKGEDKPQPQAEADGGAGKDGGMSDPMAAKGNDKPQPQDGSNGPDSAENQGGMGKPQPQAEEQAGQAKNSKPEPGGLGREWGEGKPAPNPEIRTGDDKGEGKPGEQSSKGQAKEGDPSGNAANTGQPGDAKGERSEQAKAEGKDAGQQGSKENAEPGAGKEEGTKATATGEEPKGTNKPEQLDGEEGGQGVAKAADKPDPNAKSGTDKTGVGEENLATKEDVDALKKDLKSNDPQKRAEAVRELKEMGQKAQDEQVRQAANDALQEAGEQPGPEVPPTEQRNPTGNQADAGDAKEPPGGMADAGMNKGGQPNGQESQAKGDPIQDNGKGQDGTPIASEKTTQPGTEAGNAKGNGTDQEQNPGNTRTPGGGDREGNIVGAGDGSEAPPGEKSDAAHQRRAGELQLEDIRNQVSQEDLKRANITEEEYQQFLKAYEAMLRRQKAAAASAKRDGPQQGGNLSSLGPRQVESSSTGEAQKLLNAGAALPPPEFRDAYRQFTEELAKMRKKP